MEEVIDALRKQILCTLLWYWKHCWERPLLTCFFLILASSEPWSPLHCTSRITFWLTRLEIVLLGACACVRACLSLSVNHSVSAGLSFSMCMWMCACVCEWVSECDCVFVCVCMREHTGLCVCVFLNLFLNLLICMWVSICVCVCFGCMLSLYWPPLVYPTTLSSPMLTTAMLLSSTRERWVLWIAQTMRSDFKTTSLKSGETFPPEAKLTPCDPSVSQRSVLWYFIAIMSDMSPVTCHEDLSYSVLLLSCQTCC